MVDKCLRECFQRDPEGRTVVQSSIKQFALSLLLDIRQETQSCSPQ
jgi:hypothetical protein